MTDGSSSPVTRRRPRRRLWLGLAGAFLVLVVGVGVATWYFLFRDDSPEAVSLERATRSLDRSTVTTAGGTSSTSLEGTWTVDRTIGKFADFTNAFVGYRVQEQLVGIGAKTAVGRTPEVTGSLTIEGRSITAAKVDVDMTTLTSDDSRRDGQMRTQALETNRFPTASFVLTEPIELTSIPAEGQQVSVNATGRLTLHGVTRDVTIPLQAQLTGGVITVVGQLDVAFADYNISRPSSVAVLSTEDHGILELQLFFTKSS